VSVEDALRDFFARDARGAITVYLFGSEARATAAKRSDVDVALLYARAPEPRLSSQPYDVEDDLSGLLGRRVQVIVLNTASPDLVHRVLRDGKIVLDRDRGARIRFEVAARNAYLDMRPVRDRYRRGRAAR
jgi:predicted nucleotidyltransferase